MQRLHQQLLHMLQQQTLPWQSQTSSRRAGSRQMATQPCGMRMTRPLVSPLPKMIACLQRLLCNIDMLPRHSQSHSVFMHLKTRLGRLHMTCWMQLNMRMHVQLLSA
jgi:hypothetical protein